MLKIRFITKDMDQRMANYFPMISTHENVPFASAAFNIRYPLSGYTISR